MTGRMVDADRARAHVRQLIAGGMTQADIYRAAGISGAALQILLHGHYTPSRPRQHTIHERTEARLLSVELNVRQPTRRADAGLCMPGQRYTVVGYKVGRCDECGQIAPLRRLLDRTTLIGHPEPEAAYDDENEAD